MSLPPFALLVTVLLVSPPRAAFGQGTSVDAEELFKQGRAALEAKDYATACPRFQASLKIERAVGTLMSLATCEEATQKLAAARQHWQEAADLAEATHDRLKRGPICREHFVAIDPRVPRLLLRLAKGVPTDTVVERDGVALVTVALGVAMPVDPGRHTVDVRAPNHEPRHKEIILGEGQSQVLELAPGPLRNAPPGDAPKEESPPEPAPGLGPFFWGGVGVAGAGLVVGAVLGGVALSNTGDLSSACPGKVCTTPDAQSHYDTAKATALGSDVAFGVAAAGAAVAVYAFVTRAHKPKEPAASFWLGPRSIGLRGDF